MRLLLLPWRAVVFWMTRPPLQCYVLGSHDDATQMIDCNEINTIIIIQEDTQAVAAAKQHYRMRFCLV